MDIGKCFRDAWGLFKLDLGPLVVTAAIAGVIIGVVTLIVGLVVGGGITAVRFGGFGAGVGIASALLAYLVLALISVVAYTWMIAVVMRMILRRVREGRPADYADMGEFDQLGTFIVAYIVLGVIIAIGYFVFVIPGLIATTLWIFALPLIVDRQMSLGKAMSESQRMAAGPGYFTTFITWLVGAVVVGVVVGVLRFIPVIGIVIGLLAVPFGFAYVLSMYFQSTGEGHLIDSALGK